MLISRTGITQAAAASPPQPRCRMPLDRTLREVRPLGQLVTGLPAQATNYGGGFCEASRCSWGTGPPNHLAESQGQQRVTITGRNCCTVLVFIHHNPSYLENVFNLYNEMLQLAIYFCVKTIRLKTSVTEKSCL